jgi:hypothetical protein
MASDHSIFGSYQKLLAEQVTDGRLDAATQAVRLLHANRVLEACLRSLTPRHCRRSCTSGSPERTRAEGMPGSSRIFRS